MSHVTWLVYSVVHRLSSLQFMFEINSTLKFRDTYQIVDENDLRGSRQCELTPHSCIWPRDRRTRRARFVIQTLHKTTSDFRFSVKRFDLKGKFAWRNEWMRVASLFKVLQQFLNTSASRRTPIDSRIRGKQHTKTFFLPEGLWCSDNVALLDFVCVSHWWPWRAVGTSAAGSR